MQISIVIGTLNRPDVAAKLIKQLVAISKQIPMEVVVFDQSLPEEYRRLQKTFPKKKHFILTRLEKPNTCAYLNLGWRDAHAPIVLYLDDDVSINQKAVQAHIDAYQQASVCGVAGRVINVNEVMNTREVRVGKILWFGAAFIKNFSSERRTYVDFPYGCNMSFRKQTLQELNGFDQRLAPPIYAFNEIDLGYRINKRWKQSILFEPQALVHHYQSKEGGTRNNFNAQDVFCSNQFNYGYFLGKNFSWIQNILCCMRRSVYQIIHEPRAIPYILKGLLYAKRHA